MKTEAAGIILAAAALEEITKHPGDQLPTEADAEHRHATLVRVADHLDLVVDPVRRRRDLLVAIRHCTREEAEEAPAE